MFSPSEGHGTYGASACHKQPVIATTPPKIRTNN